MEVILFMSKRITANLYTETRIIWNGYEHLAVRNDDGTLFSQGHYKTHILPADLPEWYVYGRYYRNFGYLSAKGVRHLHYQNALPIHSAFLICSPQIEDNPNFPSPRHVLFSIER